MKETNNHLSHGSTQEQSILTDQSSTLGATTESKLHQEPEVKYDLRIKKRDIAKGLVIDFFRKFPKKRK